MEFQEKIVLRVSAFSRKVSLFCMTCLRVQEVQKVCNIFFSNDVNAYRQFNQPTYRSLIGLSGYVFVFYFTF